MTQHPENSDPIASAGQIDDPDQPTTVHGKDDSRPGRDTQPDESTADGDPDQPGSRVRPAAGAHTVESREGRADEQSGKPPKALSETGFPAVGEGTVDAQHAREVDSEALAATRKFQPRPGENNPNISDDPQDRLDRVGGAMHGRTTGDPRTEQGTAAEQGGTSRGDRTTAEHVAGPRGGVRDGSVEAQAPGTDRQVVEESTRARTTSAGTTGTGEGDPAHYQEPEDVPEVEPVRHSRMVEERVQEQERSFDMGTTEDGQRYLTPKDAPGV